MFALHVITSIFSSIHSLSINSCFWGGFLFLIMVLLLSLISFLSVAILLFILLIIHFSFISYINSLIFSPLMKDSMFLFFKNIEEYLSGVIFIFNPLTCIDWYLCTFLTCFDGRHRIIMVTAYRCHVGSLLSTSHLYVTFCKSMHVGSKLKLTRTFFTNGLSALEDVSLLGEQIS